MNFLCFSYLLPVCLYSSLGSFEHPSVNSEEKFPVFSTGFALGLDPLISSGSVETSICQQTIQNDCRQWSSDVCVRVWGRVFQNA